MLKNFNFMGLDKQIHKGSCSEPCQTTKMNLFTRISSFTLTKPSFKLMLLFLQNTLMRIFERVLNMLLNFSNAVDQLNYPQSISKKSVLTWLDPLTLSKYYNSGVYSSTNWPPFARGSKLNLKLRFETQSFKPKNKKAIKTV